MLEAIRTRRRYLVGGILAGLAIAALLSFITVRTYVSSTQLFVSVNQQKDTSAAYEGNLFTQQRIVSYAQLLTSPELAQQVVDELRLPLTARQVASKVSATPVTDTVVLDVQVTDTSAERAQAIATSLARHFTDRVYQLETPQGSTQPTVKVSTIQPADFNPHPVSPDIPSNLWRGAAVGLVVGLAAALVSARLDRTVRTDEDVRDATHTPVISRVREDPRVAKHRVLTAQDGQSAANEGYRAIRTHLQHVPAGDRPQVVVVTSALPDEGKSTVAVNLAVSLARSGSRVVIVDGNLRRPRVARYLGLDETAGLTDVLAGRAALSEAVMSSGNGRLSVIGAGPMPADPAEVLGSSQMRSLVKLLRGTQEFVIIDAPALLPVTDAAVLSELADGCLIVTRYGRTRREQLAEAASTVSRLHATTLGVVLNRVPRKAADVWSDHRGYKPDPDRRSVTPAGEPDDDKSAWSTRQEPDWSRTVPSVPALRRE